MMKKLILMLALAAAALAAQTTPGYVPTARSYAQFAAAVTALGANNGALTVNGTITIASNYTIPANVEIHVAQGGAFSIGSSATLTINGPFDAGLHQAFSGAHAANVVFGAGSTAVILPEWWGAANTVLQVALNVADASSVKVIQLQGTAYSVYHSPLYVGSGLTLQGVPGATVITTPGECAPYGLIVNKHFPQYNAASPCPSVPNPNLSTGYLAITAGTPADSNITIRNLTLSMGSTAGYGVQFYSCDSCKIDGATVIGGTESTNQGIIGYATTNMEVKGNTVFNTYGDGINIMDSLYFNIHDNYVHDSRDYGIEVGRGVIPGLSTTAIGFGRISHNTLIHNNNYGIAVTGGWGTIYDGYENNPNGLPISEITIDSNTISNNAAAASLWGGLGSGIGINDNHAGITVTGNTIDGSNIGILSTSRGGVTTQKNCNISHNMIVNGLKGIQDTYGPTACLIAGNTVSNNSAEALKDFSCMNCLVSGNQFLNNNTSNASSTEVALMYTTGTVFKSNYVSDSQSGTSYSFSNSGGYSSGDLFSQNQITKPYSVSSGDGTSRIENLPLVYKTGTTNPNSSMNADITGQKYLNTATGTWWMAYAAGYTSWAQIAGPYASIVQDGDGSCTSGHSLWIRDSVDMQYSQFWICAGNTWGTSAVFHFGDGLNGAGAKLLFEAGANLTPLTLDDNGNAFFGNQVNLPAGRVGTFTCTGAGTITISNTNETTTSLVTFSMKTAGGTITTPPTMKTVTGGTGFTVLCGATDTSIYNYGIWN